MQPSVMAQHTTASGKRQILLTRLRRHGKHRQAGQEERNLLHFKPAAALNEAPYDIIVLHVDLRSTSHRHEYFTGGARTQSR